MDWRLEHWTRREEDRLRQVEEGADTGIHQNGTARVDPEPDGDTRKWYEEQWSAAKDRGWDALVSGDGERGAAAGLQHMKQSLRRS